MTTKYKEFYGDLWRYHPNSWVGITTNGSVTKARECVMGRGCALEAKKRYPSLPRALGERIIMNGNVPAIFPEWKIITIPVKHRWYDQADKDLITNSIVDIVKKLNDPGDLLWYGVGDSLIYIPRPGCGNGRLTWENDIENLMHEYLTDQFVVCHNGKHVTDNKKDN